MRCLGRPGPVSLARAQERRVVPGSQDGEGAFVDAAKDPGRPRLSPDSLGLSGPAGGFRGDLAGVRVARSQGLSVFRVSDAQKLQLTDEWGEGEKALVAFGRSFG